MEDITWQRLKVYDDNLRSQYGSLICGVDESARGSWVGPMAGGACVLPPDAHLPGLRDSKKMSPAARARLAGEIKQMALAWSVVFVQAKEIDALGITKANDKVMRCAVDDVRAQLGSLDLVVVDQSPFERYDLPLIMMSKADDTSLCVAAAAVLAKTSRDAEMLRLHALHPEYGWDRSKGYIDQAHKDAVIRLGMIPGLYRRCFSVKGITPLAPPPPAFSQVTVVPWEEEITYEATQ